MNVYLVIEEWKNREEDLHYDIKGVYASKSNASKLVKEYHDKYLKDLQYEWGDSLEVEEDECDKCYSYIKLEDNSWYECKIIEKEL